MCSIADPELIGRDAERRYLDDLLDELPVAGRALLVRGDPGVGKTTLLDYVEHKAASRYQVYRVRGVESETTLPFAALGELLLPLRRRFSALPRAQRENLETALALSELVSDSAVNPYAVCVATLNVLSLAGHDRPLVALVDDLQWVDADSVNVFRFVARRVTSDHVAFIAATRKLSEEPRGHAVLDVTGLSERECRLVLDSHRLVVAPGVLDALVGFSRGNPLILLEFAFRLSEAQRRGEEPLPAAPARGGRAEQGWTSRIRALPAPTQRALVLVAAAREPTVEIVDRALGAWKLAPDDLTAAEEARLVRVVADRYELVHPILRSVALSNVPVGVRRQAYRALGEGATGATRAWYLACAVSRPDEDVAAGLVQAAREARQCGSYLAAAQAWRRAAELTPARSNLTAGRLLDAARDAFAGGACDDAARWCEEARATATDPALRADIALLHGRALTWMGSVRHAHRLMSTAAEAIAPTDSVRAAALAHEAALPAVMHADPAGAIAAARRGMELATSAAGVERCALFLCQGLALTHRVEDACRELDRALAAFEGTDPAATGIELTNLAQVCFCVERYEDSQRLLHAVLDGARRSGNPVAYAFAFGVRSELGWWLGQWSAAYADCLEATAKGRALRQRGVVAAGLLMQARFDAARGDHAGCERRAAEAIEFTDFTDVRSMQIYREAALGLDCLSRGAGTDAAVHLGHAQEIFVRFGLGNPNVTPFAGDAVEAHLRAGNPGAARDTLAWLEECADRTGLRWQRAVSARCRALLADDPDAADAAFREALAEHDRLPTPFDHARTLLCYGEALRRTRQKARSRGPLLAAHRMFSSLGAAPWTQRCLAELAASGHHPPRARRAGGLDRLSPQELQVARMVAAGLTNTEVGSALFVSPKTVEAHLTSIYRKLRVPSRTGLTRLVTESGLSDC
ncbi:helix-turn-helix transcriptional regulator [Cryptosporangium aurantiacum]|uniref:helix-turn-helix transcriptional regulator n=1 Tax=Cryptosporangium aurantiacum TaxID=134849 RepID=UPI000932A891|nr:LuxR family transcriptional regulator [Cryptosporangium aurantiacum]